MIERYVALIDDPERARYAVEALPSYIIRDIRGSSLGTDVDTPDKRQKCKAAWVKFIAANREKLRGKPPFSLKDPIPIEELFPGIRFSRRGDQE